MCTLEGVISMVDELKIQSETISTRSRAVELAQTARSKGFSVIDLSEVEFISRSVADELVHQTEKNDLELCGLHGDVKAMVDIVQGSAAPA